MGQAKADARRNPTKIKIKSVEACNKLYEWAGLFPRTITQSVSKYVNYLKPGYGRLIFPHIGEASGVLAVLVVSRTKFCVRGNWPLWSPVASRGSSRGLPWPPVDDGTPDIY